MDAQCVGAACGGWRTDFFFWSEDGAAPRLFRFDFSALSALKKTSSGDSCLATDVWGFASSIAGLLPDVEELASTWGERFSSLSRRDARLGCAVPLGTDLEKNFGIGSEEGAGDAWNVGPA
jgi:hypothetical protein